MYLRGCGNFSPSLVSSCNSTNRRISKYSPRILMNSKTGHRLVPKLWETLPVYTRQRFVADLIAGVTVGLVALPLAMAFAIGSNVPPQAGIYTAIIAGIIVSVLGGSRCQIAGPTGAFMVLVG